VVAEQHDGPIFQLAASFQVAEDGFSHQVPTVSPPSPESLAPAGEVIAEAGEPNVSWFAALSERFPFEMRFDGELPRVATARGERPPPRQRVWLRALEPLPDDPMLHGCAVTYASDMFLLGAALPPHGVTIGTPGLQSASLDHTVWFHAPFRADDWLYYDQEGTRATGGRALCRGLLYDRAGALVATVMQEGLIRNRRRR
jgi:acyl-CoA thioesterase-2